MQNEKVFNMTFARIYPLYIAKVQKKERTIQELDLVLCWLTGYTPKELKQVLVQQYTLAEFFDNCPLYSNNASKITGVICGIRLEDIEDPLMQKIRYMDKIVDELAKGKSLDKIMRT